MGVEDLDIKLLVSSDTLTPALNKLNTSIGALTDKLETATVKERSFGDAGVDASDRISTSTDSLKDVYTEFNSKLELVRKGFEMLKKAAEMAAQAMGELTQQAQLDRLAEVVEIETLTHRVEELANRQSDLTRFSREQTREIAATFVQATIGLRLTMPQIEEGIRLTQDLMEATGRSGREAASVVARIYAGNLESINELLPGQRTHLNLLRREAEMRDRIALEQSGYNQYQQEYLALLQEQDRAIELSVAGLETLQTAYSGAAEAIDPIEQEIQQVTNELAEFRDELIRLALQQESESVRNYSRAMRALSVDLRGTAVSVQTLQELAGGFRQEAASGPREFGESTAVVAARVARLNEELASTTGAMVLFGSEADTAAQRAELIEEGWREAGDAFVHGGNRLQVMARDWEGMGAVLERAATAGSMAARDLNEAISTIAEQPIGPGVIEQTTQDFNDLTESVQELVNQAAHAGVDIDGLIDRFPGLTVQLTRAGEASETFRRRMERVGEASNLAALGILGATQAAAEAADQAQADLDRERERNRERRRRERERREMEREREALRMQAELRRKGHERDEAKLAEHLQRMNDMREAAIDYQLKLQEQALRHEAKVAISQSKDMLAAQEAEAKASEVTAIGGVKAIAAAAGPLFENKQAYAGLMGAIETAESLAAFASLNVWGGIAHGVAAAAYFKAAGEAASAAGSGGGASSAAPRIAAVSTAPPPQDIGSGGGGGRSEVHIHLDAPMIDPYRAGRDAAQALSRYAELDNGDRLDPRLTDRGRARGF